MKTILFASIAASVAMAATVVAPAQALQEESFFEQAGSEAKYTPGDFKPAPDKMKTRYGTLEFPGGYPTEETVQQVYDELDLQHATQLYLDMYPVLSSHGLMKGWVRDLGMRDSSDILVTANRLDPTGQDRGKGGKYLLLPPGYDGEVPDGYFVVRSRTYMNFSFLRANAEIVGSGDKALKFYRENTKVYPDRQWESPYITNNSTFYQNDYINLGARTAFHFTADGITPATFNEKTWIPNDVELVK